MTTNNLLPETDPDLQLARSLGRLLDTGQPFSQLNDALLTPLLQFKNDELQAIDQLPDTNRLWDSINQQTAPRKATITPLFSTRTLAWASAAVIVLAAFIGIFLMNQQPDIELVAQSGSTIEHIILEDGTDVTLRPNSSLFKTNKSDRAYSLTGEAFFDVVKDPDSPFTVAGSQGTITVLGTRFNVSTWGDRTTVYLEEGSVRFEETSTGESVLLKPGESSEIINGSLSVPAPANVDTYTDWISNTIFFQSSSPEEVIAELNQHFGVRIDITQLADQSGIDGTLRLDSINQTLSDLGIVLGGTFRQTAENEYEFIPME